MPNGQLPTIYLPDTWYLVSAGSRGLHPVCEDAARKELIRDHLQRLVREGRVSLRAWVILDDHYHLLIKEGRRGTLPDFFKRFHHATAQALGSLEGTPNRSVWTVYRDAPLRGEKAFWTRFNYIHHNPVLHGQVKDLAEWSFSSYDYYLRTKGEAWLGEHWAEYPADRLTVAEDSPWLEGPTRLF
jgi:putative transposase